MTSRACFSDLLGMFALDNPPRLTLAGPGGVGVEVAIAEARPSPILLEDQVGHWLVDISPGLRRLPGFGSLHLVAGGVEVSCIPERYAD